MFCNMSQTSYKMPKMPDEFEMNIEFIFHRNKSGYNARVSWLIFHLNKWNFWLNKIFNLIARLCSTTMKI